MLLLKGERHARYLHWVVQLFILSFFLQALLLFLQQLLSLEVASGSMLHGIVCILRVCLRETNTKRIVSGYSGMLQVW